MRREDFKLYRDVVYDPSSGMTPEEHAKFYADAEKRDWQYGRAVTRAIYIRAVLSGLKLVSTVVVPCGIVYFIFWLGTQHAS